MTTTLQEIQKTSTNGRYGITIVCDNTQADDVYRMIPVKGALKSLGNIQGHDTYQIVPGDNWIVFDNDAEIIVGAVIVKQEYLQSNNSATLIVGGDFFAIRRYGYKRRDNDIVVFQNGQKIDCPPTILVAMGVLPGKIEDVVVEIPALSGALQDALQVAKLTS